MRFWEEEYKGNTIRIENRLSGEKLFINGYLQDERFGLAFRSTMWGKLPTGEEVKVSLGGNFRMNCIIFVDNQLIFKTGVETSKIYGQPKTKEDISFESKVLIELENNLYSKYKPFKITKDNKTSKDDIENVLEGTQRDTFFSKEVVEGSLHLYKIELDLYDFHLLIKDDIRDDGYGYVAVSLLLNERDVFKSKSKSIFFYRSRRDYVTLHDELTIINSLVSHIKYWIHNRE